MPAMAEHTPLEEAWGGICNLVRRFDPHAWKKPHFNFIMAHYIYILSCSILGSIILYPIGGIAYIDTLFFTAGASTQAGLNTVNINDIYLSQQIILFFIACIANPIFINSGVVFLRLYWFEKKFKNIIEQEKRNRRSRTTTLSKSRSQMAEAQEQDLSRLEMALGQRRIEVLHETTKPNGMTGSTAGTAGAEKEFLEKMGIRKSEASVSPTPDGSGTGSGSSEEGVAGPKGEDADAASPPSPSTYLGLNPRLNREITFADELSGSNNEREDHQSPPGWRRRGSTSSQGDRHIRFLQQQRQTAKSEAGTLRIPGPRDFDRGELPQELHSDEDLHRPQSRDTIAPETGRPRPSHASTDDDRTEEFNLDDHTTHRAITFDEPMHPDRHARDGTGIDVQPDDHGFFQSTLTKVKSGLSHRRNRSKSGVSLTNAKSSMAKTFGSLTTARSTDRYTDPMPYLSWQATIGRNSKFVGLNQAQREELGGIEYRALKTLAKVLVAYYVGFHILAMAILLPWILHTQPWKSYVRSCGVVPGWWAVWTAQSAFNDLGLTLTPDSMISFQTSVLTLLVMSYFIIIGNTGFPCMLRFIIWVTSKWMPYGSRTWEELRFLLDHPRRCFTLLFPSRATWWLFWVLVGLNSIDLIFFIILDLNDPIVTSLAPGLRVLNGWFQATSTRTAGFSSVNIADLHPAIQVSYMIMMYISVFPIAISIRRTNVYEEKSLGIWGGEEETSEEGDKSFVGQHLRRQLSFDLWYVFLGFFIICIVEGNRLGDSNQYAFNMFAVLFEIVSAYGTVGLSLGYPTNDMSFSAEFHLLSKLVVIAMMIRGRHRGLPYALDRAILLPSEHLHKSDEVAGGATIRRASAIEAQEKGENWEHGDLDAMGLPRQNTADDAMMAGVGVVRRPGSNEIRCMRRQSTSGLSTASKASGQDGQRRRPGRKTSIGMMLASGLVAGPTTPQRDLE